MRAWVARHPVPAYFVLAYAFSWSIAVPLALQAQGVLATSLPWALHYLTAFGPAAAAFTIARLLREPGRVGGRAPSVTWWTIGFVSPLLLFAVAQWVARAAGQAPPTWTALGRVNFLPNLGLGAWLLWFVTSGWGEELGWRGFALPRLKRTHSALISSVLLSIGWAVSRHSSTCPAMPRWVSAWCPGSSSGFSPARSC